MEDTAPRGQRLVLVADGTPDDAESLAGTLAQGLEGVEVCTVRTGTAALDVLAKKTVVLLLTDRRMPDMDGLSLLAQARRVAPATPAILMAAHPDVEMAITAVNEHRIARLLTKPVDGPAVIRAVEEVLARREETVRSAQRVALALAPRASGVR